MAHCQVLLWMDNVAVVRYINHLGGTKSRLLASLVKDFWELCLSRHVSVMAEHLPGVSNQLADWHSRHLHDGSLWRLNPTLFAKIQAK